MRKPLLLLTMLPMAVLLTMCGDDDEPKTIPSVTTLPATDIGTNTATLAGEVTDDGNAKIIAVGFVYSSIVAEPTIADEKIELIDTDEEFTAVLEGLNSGTTYHVRAYATNSKGIAYGTKLDVATGNAAPTVTGITVTGDAEVNKTLTVSYTYNDAEGDAEGATSFQWYVANDATGTAEVAIADATENTYTVKEAQQAKYIRVGVTPKAATGNTNGSESKSTAVGAVGEATTVTFMYNGQLVTYGIINSTTTGRKWLDRNLGAVNTPNSVDDWANYGDLFQWGRLDDGHQLITRSGPGDAAMSAVNGVTTTNSPFQVSSTDVPGHKLFIVMTGEDPNDWRVPQNDNFWQGVDGINNPCPEGWRIPTQAELVAENFTNIGDAYNKLKFTLTGQRASVSTANGIEVKLQFSQYGFYWTSTTDNITNPLRHQSQLFFLLPTGSSSVFTTRTPGYACRCIKN